MDLGDLWRDRRWRTLLNLIDYLPRNSNHGDAVAGDTELAAQLVDTDTVPEGTSRPRMADWSLEAERLTDVCNQLMQVCQLLVSIGGGKPGQPKPLRGPLTAVEDEQARAREEGVAVLNRLLARDQ